MPADDSGTLKLIKGGAPSSGGPTRTVRRRSATRRRVTRRTPVPGAPDPVTEVLERLDEEPVESPEPMESPAPAKRPEPLKDGRTTPRRRKVIRTARTAVALLALLCLALAVAAVFGSRWYGDRQLEKAHQQALAAAKQTTVDFVSVSAASVDRDLQRIVAGSTGDFKDEFTRGQSQVRAAVVENNVESRGTVLRAALMSGDRRRAVVLVAMDATVRNAKAPEGRASHYRIQVEMARDPDSGRWLVSRLQFVG
jgi:Mce-associated membrane protein